MTIEQSEITHLRALLAKATPGPWKHYRARLRPNMGPTINEVQARRGPVVSWLGFEHSDIRRRQHVDNAALISAARNALPMLLDAYEAQAAEIERLRSALDAVVCRVRDERLRADKQADAVERHPIILGNTKRQSTHP